MVDSAYYLVSEDIIRRSGLLGQRYKTNDDKYVLNNKDLARIRMTSEEFINGLSGVEMITIEEAKRLISQGEYSFGEEIGIEQE